MKRDTWANNRDGHRIIDSRYSNSLCYKEGKKGAPLELMMSKISLAKMIAGYYSERYPERYSLDEEFCDILLNTMDLATPPLGDLGKKFMEQELDCTKKQAYVAIAEEIGLSDDVVAELKSDEPLSVEGAIVRFVEESFGSLPEITPSIHKDIMEGILVNENGIKTSPELDEKIKQWSHEGTTSLRDSLHEEKTFQAIRTKLEKLGATGNGMDTVLQFIRSRDDQFTFLKQPGQPGKAAPRLPE